jgi:hypothetical protein
MPLLTSLVFVCSMMMHSAFAQHWVVSTQPSVNSLSAAPDEKIVIKFNRPMNAGSVNANTFLVYGDVHGAYDGSRTYDPASTSMTFSALQKFGAGERITVQLTLGIRSASGDTMFSTYGFQFTIRTSVGSNGGITLKKVIDTRHYNPGIVKGDFDKDGREDLALAGTQGLIVETMIRRPDGTYKKDSVDTGEGTRIVSGDWNRDGFIDLAVADRATASIRILLNDKQGTFSSSHSILLQGQCTVLERSDMDGDGDLDLLVARENSNIVDIYQNEGTGDVWYKVFDIYNYGNTACLTVGDLDKDGDMDIAAAKGADSIAFFINDGHGIYIRSSAIGVSNPQSSIVSCDLEGDGDLDFAVASSSSSFLSLLINDGTGQFTKRNSEDAGHFSDDIAVGDLNGDRKPDIVSIRIPYPSSISVMLNDGTGHFIRDTLISITDGITDVVMGDWDSNGFIDVAATHYFGTASNLKLYFTHTAVPILSLSTDRLIFQQIQPGLTAAKKIVVTNEGFDSVLHITVQPPNGSIFSVTPMSMTVPPGISDTFTVSYAPVDLQPYNDSIVLLSNDANRGRTVVTLAGSKFTPVSGVIIVETVWTKDKSPYVVIGPLHIASDASLRIDKGVQVLFNGEYPFTVNGLFTVIGTLDDSVIFTGKYNSANRSSGIRLNSGSRSKIRYAVFEEFKTAVDATEGAILDTISNLLLRKNDTGLKVTGLSNSNRKFNFLRFEKNDTGVVTSNSFAPVWLYDSEISQNTIGLYIKSGSFIGIGLTINKNSTGVYGVGGNTAIANSIISENSQYGISLPNSQAFINSNSITDNFRGILLTSTGHARDNLISGNTEYGVRSGGTCEVSANNIVSNSSNGLIVDGTVTVRDNTISSNGTNGIKVISGSPSIQYNTIINNSIDGIVEAGTVSFVFKNNNIYGNGRYDCAMTSEFTWTLTAEHNYWGTVNLELIEQKIFDNMDRPLLGIVDVIPFTEKKIRPGGNAAPTVKIESDGSDYKDTVQLSYLIYDAENDTVSLSFAYSFDKIDWKPATVLGAASGIISSAYRNDFKWLSRTDLNAFTGTCYFRVQPYDRLGPGTADSAMLHMVNNKRSTGTITAVQGQVRGVDVYSGSITMSVQVSDPEQDSASLKLYYRRDSLAATWRSGTVSGDTVKSTVGTRSIVWKTLTDIPASPGRYFIRCIPFDYQQGDGDSISVVVDNVGVPALKISLGNSDEYSGTVVIPYTIDQISRSAVSVTAEFTTNSGDVWLPATIGNGQSTQDSLHFSDTLKWNSAADIPGLDFPKVRVRLTPSSPVAGISDVSAAVHVDNNTPPFCDTVITPVSKAVGDQLIQARVSDKENDTFSIAAEFTTNAGVQWNKATVKNISYGPDTVQMIWQTSADLFNKDQSVTFRITPFDNDPGGSNQTGSFRVDNVTGPTLTSTLPAVLSINDSLTVMFDRAVTEASVHAGLELSTLSGMSVPFNTRMAEGNRTIVITSTKTFPVADTLVLRLSSDAFAGIKDSLGNSLDGNGNGDLDGSPADDRTLLTRTPLLADYDLDNKVNVNDLVLFRRYWLNQDLNKDIAPALNAPPKMNFVGDSVIDFEDLMVFVRNWNWSMKNGRTIASAADVPKRSEPNTKETETDGILMLAEERTRTGKQERFYNVRLKEEVDLVGMEMEFRYDPAAMVFKGLTDHKVFDRVGGGKTVTLSYHDSARGYVVASVANFGPQQTIGRNPIVTFAFTSAQEGSSLSPMSYTIIDGAGRITSGVSSVTVEQSTSVPTVYGLSQNYPNPFNPVTKIDYQLPNDGFVTLALYNVLGQEVARLVNGEHRAGYYSITVDGNSLSSGVYIYRISSGDFVSTKRMLLLK